jgi:hypothetical protein
VVIEEGDHRRNERSSAAIAKYALALRRISFAWQFAVLPLQRLHPPGDVAQHPGARAAIDLRFLHPLVQRLVRAADPRRGRH